MVKSGKKSEKSEAVKATPAAGGKLVDKAAETEKEEKKNEKQRDWSGDLMQYVTQWKGDKSSWKFNKLLQTWALQKWWDKDSVDKNLFHALLPYLGSVMGGAREGLLKKAEELLASELEESESMTVKRARKVKEKLSNGATEETIDYANAKKAVATAAKEESSSSSDSSSSDSSDDEE